MPSVLPPELLYHISSFLVSRNADLAALARVCARWSAIAHRVLYLHVNLSISDLRSPLSTLANNKRLAAAVRSFSVSLPSRPHDHTLLVNALQNMSHLVQLDIFVDSHQPTSSWSSILRNTTSYPLIQRFATSLPWNEDLLHFLNKSPTITQLYLDSHFSSPHLSLSPSFLPSLSHFTGPPSLALLLIPHRPVQHIDLTSSNMDSQGLTPSLALALSQSSAPVLALAATTSSTPRHPQGEDLVDVLRVLAACMAHLRHLRVVANTYADAFDFGGTVFDDTYFENITTALSSLPDLQSCEIWGFHWVSSKKVKKSIHSSASNSWLSPSFNTSNAQATANTTNLEDLYQDLIFPY